LIGQARLRTPEETCLIAAGSIVRAAARYMLGTTGILNIV